MYRLTKPVPLGSSALGAVGGFVGGVFGGVFGGVIDGVRKGFAQRVNRTLQVNPHVGEHATKLDTVCHAESYLACAKSTH